MGFSLGGFLGISRDRTAANQTSVVQAAPETAGEQAIRLENERLGLSQTQGYADLLGTETGALGASDQGLLDRSTQGLLDAIAQGGISLSPEQIAALNERYGFEVGEFERGLGRTARDIAAQRGLALSDSPIANPYLEESRRGLAQFGAARATSALQLGQQGFSNTLALKQFQENLRQIAFQRRAGLLTGQPGSVGYQQGQQAFRLGQPTTQTTGRTVTTGLSGGLKGTFGLGG